VSDINFYFDPVCPFAWMTSKWVRRVQAQRDYEVDWRFISLRLLNSNIDYDTHFPPEYEAGHNAGLRMLRMAAAARDAHGRDAMSALQQSFGDHIFEVAQSDAPDRHHMGTPEHVTPILQQSGLPTDLTEALYDESWDTTIQSETDEALALTGKDVGTPIIHFEPPEGVAFFGPVISRMPADDQALELWEHVIGLARFPSFTEMKRSLRELPQLPALGVAEEEAGQTEDWHQGSRRQKK
jgi:2-hydroxychromene-2-carboxylate isomerase